MPLPTVFLAILVAAMLHADVASGHPSPLAPVMELAQEIGAAAPGEKLWSFRTGADVRSSPTVVGGTVYIGSNDKNVYALDARTGQQMWNFTTGGQVSSSPTVVNGMMYVGSYDFNIYALDARTGLKLWNFTTGNYVYSSPTVVNGTLYVGSEDGNVYALQVL